MARGLKFLISDYLCSGNRGSGQLRGYCTADLHLSSLVSYMQKKKRVCNDIAHIQTEKTEHQQCMIRIFSLLPSNFTARNY